MPIVDLAPPPIDTFSPRPEGFAVTPGKDEIDHGSDTPDAPMLPYPGGPTSVVGAAFRQGNIGGSAIARKDWGAEYEPDEPGFNPWDAIKGTKYEPHWNSFVDIRSTAAADARKRQLDMEEEDRRTLAGAPWYKSFPAQLLAGGADLPSLLPGGAFVRGAKGGFSVLRSAAVTGAAAGVGVGAQELALHGTQQLRTVGESAENIGASVFLGGLLGAGGAKLLSRAEWNAAVEGLNRDIGRAGEPIASGAGRGIWQDADGKWHGTIRLYRGEGGTGGEAAFAGSPMTGGWFTTDLEKAKIYGEVGYIDVTRDDLMHFAQGHGGPDEFVTDNSKFRTAMKPLDAAATPAGVGEPASAGAAAVEPVSLEENTIAGRAAQLSAAVTRKLNPFMRVMQNPSAAARSIIQKLDEFAVYTKGNFENIASPRAAATMMKRWQGGVTIATNEMDQIWKDYRKAGGQLQHREFGDAVGKAMRREDSTGDPFIDKAAKMWRDKVVDPPKDEAIKVGLLPEDVKPDFAPSYFSRMWNRNRIIGEESRFKAINTEFFNDHIGKEWEKNTTALRQRLAKLDQEKEDITLSPEQRAQRLTELETQAEEHEAAGAAYQDLAEKADRLADIAAEQRRLKGAGDTMVARQNLAAAKAESAAIKEAGGKDLADFIAKRSELRRRRGHVDLGAAGLSERSQQIMETLADLEEANQRSLGRLVKKGQKLERELDKLDPDVLADRISAIKDNFAEISRRSDAAAERADKAIAGIKEEAAKRAEKAGKEAEAATASAIHGDPEQAAANRAAAKAARDKANAALEAADAKITARLEKEASRHRARSDRMAKIAERMEVAEGFDREGAVAELRAGVDKAIAETSNTTLGRGERAQRLQERLAALDPQRIKDRTAAINQMKKDLEDAYYKRWETNRLGQGVDINATTRPDFTEQAKEIANHLYNTYTGRAPGGIRPEFAPVAERGPMKDRTNPIPDLYVSQVHGAIEDFLEHNVQDVMSRYSRVMGADVEIKKAFGSLDLKDEMDAITKNYARLREGIADPAKLRKLADMEESDKTDIRETLNNIRGTRQTSEFDKNWGSIVRSANHFQYLLKMGEVTLSSLQDAVRPAMVHGIIPYMRTIGQLATNLKAIKLSVRDGQLMGNISEMVTPARLATIADLNDPFAKRGPVESLLANMTDKFSKWNGIRIWTDGMKSIASVMTQNRILANAQNWGNLSARERAYMQFLGINQSDAERIAAQFAAHGRDLNGVKWANIDAWGKTDPIARDAFAAAMNKDVDSIIVIPAKADVPLLAHTAGGKMLLQFKSFTLASHQRVMLRGLQESPARFLSGAVAMTALGMMQVYLKALSGNHLDKLPSMEDNPGWWIGEAIDKASFLPVFMELSNDFEKVTGLNPVKAPLKVFDKGRPESEKVQGETPISLAGPTVGSVIDAQKALGMVDNIRQGKDIGQGQKNAAVRLMPGNSYIGLKQFLNYWVNPPHP